MAAIVKTWERMVVGVDKLHNYIPNKHEEETEVKLATKKAHTNPRRQIALNRQNAGIVGSTSTTNQSVGGR